MKRKYNPITSVGVIAIIAVIFSISAYFFDPTLPDFNHLFTTKSSFEETQSQSFSNIQEIDVNINDVNLTIIDTDSAELTITSTVKNTGLGFISQPKVWVNKNVLYYEQGNFVGYNTQATGEVTIEVPRNLILNYDISNGSGDVLFKVDMASDANIDMAVGNLNISVLCDNLTVNTVSGDIAIHEAIKNIRIDTVSSDALLFADETVKEIRFESVSGDLNVFTNELGGYNLQHNYAGGNIDNYYQLSDSHNGTIDITAKTVDGSVELFDSDDFEEIMSFFKEVG